MKLTDLEVVEQVVDKYAKELIGKKFTDKSSVVTITGVYVYQGDIAVATGQPWVTPLKYFLENYTPYEEEVK